jgi:hypothetical protein
MCLLDTNLLYILKIRRKSKLLVFLLTGRETLFWKEGKGFFQHKIPQYWAQLRDSYSGR